MAEDVLEEALVAGERDGAGAGPRREPILLLRLPEQLPEHGVVQVRRPHHEPPRRAAHAHRHVARRDRDRRRLHRRARRRPGPPPPQRLPEPHDVPDLAAAFRHVDARASERAHALTASGRGSSSRAVGLRWVGPISINGDGRRGGGRRERSWWWRGEIELAGFWRRTDGEGELGFIGRRGPLAKWRALLPFGSSSWPRINYSESDGLLFF